MAYDKPYEHKPNYGSAFKNRDKKEDWQGDYTGKIMLPDGKLHYFNVYDAKDKNGQGYFKFKIGKEVQEPAAPTYSAAHQPFPDQSGHDRAKSNGYQRAPGFDELDNDVPF